MKTYVWNNNEYTNLDDLIKDYKDEESFSGWLDETYTAPQIVELLKTEDNVLQLLSEEYKKRTYFRYKITCH